MRQRGFTLIELCITTSIVGMLTALGLASYRGTLLRAHRHEARLALLEVQAAQERHYVNALRYAADLEAPTSTGGLGLARETPGRRYTLDLRASEDGQRYVARAVPKAGSAQTADAACLSFTVGESGQRGGTSPECWP